MRRRDVLRSTVAGAGLLAVGAPSVASTATATPGRRLKIQIVMFDGVEEMDWVGPFYPLSMAGKLGGAIDTSLVALDGPRTVVCSNGVGVAVPHGWSPRTADVIVVPGGGQRRGDGPGVGREIARGVLPRALAAAKRRGLTIASVCTGALLLSAAGLTRGRPCTTHHRAQADLAAEGARVIKARVVDDGDLVTSGGITSGLELALWLVRRELGADLALQLEELMEYETRGTVWVP